MAAVKLGAPKSSCLTQSIDRTTTPTPIPDPSLPREEVHGRERGFHDALATRSQPVKRPLDVFERAILDRIGDITGLQVLDLGCGDGVLTEALLRAGARVTALDISPGMIRLAQRRVTGAGLSGNAQFVVASAEETGLPDGGFDLVVGKWVLHHTDVIQTAREIRRVLRAGGRGTFIETSALNPLLAFARRRLAGRIGIPRYGTVDEHPLASADLAAIRGCFQRLHVSFPYFFFFGLFDRQVLRYRFRRVSRLAGTIDRAVQARLPALRRYSYYVLLEMD